MKMVNVIHCNMVSDDYQQNSRVLYAFLPNNLFGQLLDISPEEFLYNEVWFTNQNSNPLEIEDKINITLFIDQSITYKK